MRNFLQSFVSDVNKHQIFSENIESNNLFLGKNNKSSSLSASCSKSIQPVMSNRTKMMDCIKICSIKNNVPTKIIDYSFPPLVYLNSIKSRNIKPTFRNKPMNKHDVMSNSIGEQERDKFIERISRNHFGSHLPQMSLAFRFIPGLTAFKHHDLSIPFNLDRLISIWNSVSSSFKSIPFSHPSLLTYSHKCAGLRSLVNDNYNKVLVEVFTYNNGMYGHFMVLVSMGVCCTVWYVFAPGLPNHVPPIDVFPIIQSYEPFLNTDHYADLFKKVCIIEQKDPTIEVLSGLMEKPFNELNIPSSNSHVIVAVGIGVMLAYFLSIGISPNAQSITI